MILAGRNSMSQLVEIKYTQPHVLINWDSFPKLCTMQRILIWCAEKLSLGPSHLESQQITLSSSHQYATIWINTAVVFQEIWLGAARKKKRAISVIEMKGYSGWHICIYESVLSRVVYLPCCDLSVGEKWYPLQILGTLLHLAICPILIMNIFHD